MKEVTGNLWDYPADARVITTNASIKKNGECVMGRGCAFEAKSKYPGIAAKLGNLIALHGNHVMALGVYEGAGPIFSFPVKHRWYENADLALIVRSASELVTLVGHDEIIVMPRPGCGNGNLKWTTVKPVIDQILDDRFHVITF